MIISHSLKMIFIAIPKTGTHSVRECIRPHLGENDLEHCGLFIRKHSGLFKHMHGHVTALQIKEKIGEKVFNDYFKFAFFRDPQERIISLFFFFHRHKKNVKATDEAIIKNHQKLSIVFRKQQSKYVCDEKGRIIVDKIYSCENMQMAVDDIGKRLGVNFGHIGMKNRHGRQFQAGEKLIKYVQKFAGDDMATYLQLSQLTN